MTRPSRPHVPSGSESEAGEFRVTDDLLAAAQVGWDLAHAEMCPRAGICSAHQPIAADVQKPRVVAALATAMAPAAQPARTQQPDLSGGAA